MAAGDLALNVIVGAQMSGTINQVISQVQQAFSNLASGNLLGALGNAADAIGTTLVTAAQDAGQFQQSLTMLSTSAGEAQSNLKAVGDGILQISTDTGTSTQQLTQAMYYIESSGQHGAAALNELSVAAEGAKTENADLTTVTNALITVMDDYHLPVQDSTSAMNGLIATVQNGRTNLQTLSSSMSQVLPAAASLGIAFPQVAGAMDAMTNAGVQSRQAAMELAHFFLALEAPSGVAEKSMQSVGLSAQEVRDALVSKGLPEALQLIEDHVGKTFPQGSIAYTDALKNITGGLMGFKVNASLTGAELPTLEKDIQAVSDAMNKNQGAVTGWDQVQQNFNTRLAQLQASFNAMMITLGEQLLPIFSQVVSWLITIVTNFTNWEEQTHFVQNALQALVTMIQTVVQWVQQLSNYLSGVWQDVAPMFDQLAQNAKVWGNNFIVGFINGMGPAVQQLINYVEQIAQEIANYLGFASPTKKGPGKTLNEWGVGMMTGLSQGIIDSIPLVSNAVNQVAQKLESVSQKGATAFQGAGKASATYTDSVSGDKMQATVNPMKMAPQQMTATMKDTGTNSADALTKALSTGVKQGVGTVQTAVNAVAKTTDTACKSAAATSKCVSDHLTTHTASAIKTKAPAVHAAAQHVGQQTNPAADAALKAAEAAHKALTTQLAKKVQSSAPAVQGAANNLANMIKQSMQNVPPATQKVSDAFSKMGKGASIGSKDIENSLTGLPAFIQRIVANIQQFLSNLSKDFEPARQAGQRFLDSLRTGYNQVIQPILKGVGDLAKGFGDFVKNITKSAQETGAFNATGQIFSRLLAVITDTVGGLVKGLSISLGPAIKAISTVVTTQIAPAFGHLLQSMVPMIPAVQALGAIIVGGLVVALGVAAGFIVGLITGLANLLAGITQAVGGIVQVISGVVQIINGILDMIIGLFTNNQNDIKEGQKALTQGLQDIWSGFGNVIMGILNGIYGFVTGLFSGLANTVSSIFTNLYDELIGHSIIPDMINAIESAFTNFGTWIVQDLEKLVQNFVQYWTQVGQEMQKLAQVAWSYVQALFQQAWERYIQPGLTAIVTGISNWWRSETAAMQVLAQDLWNAIATIFNGTWQKNLLPALTKLGQDFSAWFTQETTQFGQWALNLMKMFGQGISSGITQFLQPAINSAAQAIQNVLGIFSPAKTGPLSTADQWMPNMMKMMASGIHSGSGAVTKGATDMASGVQNSMTDMTSNVSNSAAQMKQQLQSVGQDISNMQGQVSSAIQQAKAQMQSATAEITTNLMAERSLVSQTIGYLAGQMQQMGQIIKATENQANQATATVNSDLQNTSSASKAVQVNLDLSNKATAAAWQDYLKAVSAAKQSMSAEGMSAQAQAKALSSAIKAGNDAYTTALASGKSQADALKADQAKFNSVIDAAETGKNAQTSTTNARTSTTNANTSTGAAQTSQQAAQLSGINKTIAVVQATLAGGSAATSALDAGFSMQQAGVARTNMYNASYSASQAMTSAGVSQLQQLSALSSANQAYSYAFQSSVAKGMSFQQAQQAGMSAFQAKIQATISQQQAASSKQSAQASQSSSQVSQSGAKLSFSSMTQAQSNAVVSLNAAGISGTQEVNALNSANKAASDAMQSAANAHESVQKQQEAAVGAFNSSVQATIAAHGASSAGQSAGQATQSAGQSTQSATQSQQAAQQTIQNAKTGQTAYTQTSAYQVQSVQTVKTITQQNTQASGFVQQMQSDLTQAVNIAKSIAQQAANAMASMLAMASPAKEGPLSTADKWIPNMMQMFIQGLKAEAPELKNASKITAAGVQQAFQAAAAYAGATIISLKQKRDDIYAVLSAATSSGGTPGTNPGAGVGPLYSANILGDIPIQMKAPVTSGTSGSSSDQTITVHLDLDGKTIAKTVMKYQANELRVQGAVRNK